MAMTPKKKIQNPLSSPGGGVGRGTGGGGSVKILKGTSKERADYINAMNKNIAESQKKSIKNPSILDSVKKGGTVKIKSVSAKSPDAAKAANTKALKAANKGKKK